MSSVYNIPKCSRLQPGAPEKQAPAVAKVASSIPAQRQSRDSQLGPGTVPFDPNCTSKYPDNVLSWEVRDSWSRHARHARRSPFGPDRRREAGFGPGCLPAARFWSETPLFGVGFGPTYRKNARICSGLAAGSSRSSWQTASLPPVYFWSMGHMGLGLVLYK